MKTILTPKELSQYLSHDAITRFFPKPYHAKLQLTTYQKGQAICVQGESLEYLSYFLSGKAKVSRQSANGKEHILETLEQPTLIGDIELMTQRPAVSSVIALEECLLIQLPLRYQAELLADPVFLYQIGREIAQKCYLQNIRASANVAYSVKERLATHILNHANDGLYQLELSLLADAFGTSYRHLNRVMKQLVDEGIIAKKEVKCYAIRNQKKLQLLAIQD